MPPVKPTPRPTAPPQPIPAPPSAKASDAFVLFSCALGRTPDGRYAAALLKTQGREVLECHLVHVSSKAFEAEEAWGPVAHRGLYLGEKVPSAPGRLVSGGALALYRLPNGKTAAVRLVLEEGKVEVPDFNAAAPKVDEGGPRVVYVGTKKDAWDELDRDAALHLLRESLAERRRVSSGGK